MTEKKWRLVKKINDIHNV